MKNLTISFSQSKAMQNFGWAFLLLGGGASAAIFYLADQWKSDWLIMVSAINLSLVFLVFYLTFFYSSRKVIVDWSKKSTVTQHFQFFFRKLTKSHSWNNPELRVWRVEGPFLTQDLMTVRPHFFLVLKEDSQEVVVGLAKELGHLTECAQSFCSHWNVEMPQALSQSETTSDSV